MNRTYELMFIVRPDMTEEDQDKLISTLDHAVSSSGGKVHKVEKMGKRRLAYTVRKFSDGIYVLLTFEGGGGLVHELERRLRVNEPVINKIVSADRCRLTTAIKLLFPQTAAMRCCAPA